MRLEDPKDDKKRFFRASKRLLVLNGEWYYSTREGERGPFKTREEAELQLERFKQDMRELQTFQTNRATRSEERAAGVSRARELTEKLRAARSGRNLRDNAPEVLV